MNDRPLRFCMITTFYPPYNFGGDGIFVHRLANELARRGHPVDVIHCADAYRLLAGGEPREGYTDHENVTVHRLRSRLGFISPLATQQTGYPLFKLAQIQKILRKGFDVIHYHNISLVGGPKILEYGRAVKLYTMHDHWLVCPMHLLFRFNREPCTEENCLLCQLAYKRPQQWWRYSRLLRKSVIHVDAFIHLTQFSKDIHRERGLDLPFVHLPFFPPEVEGLAGETQDEPNARPFKEPYFLFLGRLEKLKGPHTLIPVFKRFRKAHLLIAGEGNYEARLRKLAQDSSHIHFLGHLPYEQLMGLYQGAVAVIVPSLYPEISPLVIVEAFKNRAPVIVRNLGGMPELVAESGGGLIYETEDSLVSAMDDLLSHPAFRNDLGRRGFETYKRGWTAEAHLRSYFRLIGQLRERNGQVLRTSIRGDF
jgi:glycosyltransferase involved in cell wall biosynthesis